MILGRGAKIVLLSALFLGWESAGISAVKTLEVCPSGCSFSSVQKAIDAAARGDTVIVGAGTYQENVSIVKSLTLKGASQDTVVIQGLAEGKSVIRIAGSTQVVLEDLTISGAKAGPTSATLADGIRVRDKANVSLTRIQISGNADDGLDVADQAQAHIQASTIESNGDDGIFLDKQAQATIEDNSITSNGGCGVWAITPQVSGQNNHMMANGADLCGNTLPALRIPLLPVTQNAQITFPGNYSSLQEAVDAVADGGTIVVASGSYAGGLTIYKRLSLKGASRENVVLRGSGHAPVISLITGADATIEGMTLTQGRDGLKAAGQAKVTLSQITSSNNTDDGIEGRDSAVLTLQDAQLAQNAEEGLYLTGSVSASIRNSQIIGNGRDGAMLRGAVSADVQGNQILNNTGWGIALWINACHKEAAAGDTFTGLVQGGGNELSANKSGDLCGVSMSLKK
ncbi:right-handed parallel beta-helix repeat-containing protein [Candidatus Acetothermia bacterium]|nr:right-handed parallel beta-helix repeat-containing protein [Candidatus Acetothermia bacterium]